MKKRLSFVFALIAVFAAVVACSKDNISEITGQKYNLEEDTTRVLNSFTTPVCSDDTRMTYAESEDSGLKISKTWEVGDELIGFVEETVDTKTSYKYFTFRCTSTDESKATWTRVANSEYSCANTPLKGSQSTLHMAFAPGVSAKGFDGDGEIALTGSFVHQKAGAQMAIACGTGTLDADDKLDITFTNQMALISLRDLTLTGIGENTVDDIAIDGVYTSATLKLVEDAIQLAPDTESVGTMYISPAEGQWSVTDGVLFKKTSDTELNPMFVAVLPGTNLNQMSIRVETLAGPDYKHSVTADKIIEASCFRIKDKNLSPIAVASIDSEDYSTISAAFEAANNSDAGTTITLKENAKIKTALPGITNTNGVILDLNGKKLLSTANNIMVLDDQGVATDEVDRRRPYVTTGKLVIKDGVGGGQIYQSLSNNAHLAIVDGGTFEMESGTIQSTKSAAVYVRKDLGNSTDSISINLKGGTLIGESSGTAALAVEDGSYANLSIENTTITSTTSRCIHLGTKATAVIKSGTFSSYKNTVNYFSAKENDNDTSYGLEITGGKFSARSTDGRALSVAGSKNVLVSGGSLSSENSYAIYGASAGSAEVTITGDNTYLYTASSESKIGTIAVYTSSTPVTFSINNGYYNKTAGITDERLAKGYQCLTLAEPAIYDGKEYGYKVMQPTEDIISVQVGTNDAVNYKTVTAALKDVNAEANKDDEIYITLLKDITLATENFLIERVAGTSENKLVTLDLGGHTLTTQYGADKRLNFEEKSNVLITNGKIYTDVESYCLKTTNYTTVKINNNVTIESINYCAYNISGASKVTLDGCKIISGGEDYSIYMNNSLARLTINSGTEISNTNGGLTVYSTATTNNVKVNAGAKARPYMPSRTLGASQWQDKYATGEDFATVQSEAYSGDAQAFFECIPMSLKYAVATADTLKNSSTIKLLKKVTVSEPLSFTNTKATCISIDLNSQQLTSSGITRVIVSSADSLRIFDSGTDGRITISRTENSCAIEVAKGTVGIYGGTIAHTSTAKYYLRSAFYVHGSEGPANLWVHGGTIYAAGRVISAGSGSKEKKCKVYILGGVIKSTQTGSDTDNYAVLRSQNWYAYFYVWGGSIYAQKMPAIHLGSANSYTYLGDANDDKKKPYIHGNADNTLLVSRSSDYGKYYVYNAYLNLDKVTEKIKSDGTTAEITTLPTPASDGTYSDYNYLFKKK